MVGMVRDSQALPGVGRKKPSGLVSTYWDISLEDPVPAVHIRLRPIHDIPPPRFYYTECWSQGRAKLRDFPLHCGAENTQPSPSFTPTLGTLHSLLIQYLESIFVGLRCSPSWILLGFFSISPAREINLLKCSPAPAGSDFPASLDWVEDVLCFSAAVKKSVAG